MWCGCRNAWASRGEIRWRINELFRTRPDMNLIKGLLLLVLFQALPVAAMAGEFRGWLSYVPTNRSFAKCRFVILGQRYGGTGFVSCVRFRTAWKGCATKETRSFSSFAPSE